MSISQHQSGPLGDELTNFLLTGLIGLIGLTLILRGAGSVVAFLTGTSQPDAGVEAGVAVLFNPSDPAAALQVEGLSAVAYWITVGVLLGALGGGSGWVWMGWRHHTRKIQTDPHRLAGTATSHEITTSASSKALLRRAATLRPSLNNPRPQDIGYLFGRSHGKQVWASVEDSILLIGPPRSGKRLHVVIPAILDAPGAVVTTSTRPDNVAVTLRARQKIGPVAVFDPQHIAARPSCSGGRSTHQRQLRLSAFSLVRRKPRRGGQTPWQR